MKRYPLILLVILVSATFFTFKFGHQLTNTYEKAFSAQVQASLSNTKLKEINVLNETKVSLLFVGDIMLSRGVAGQIKKNNPDYPFLLAADITQEADLAFGNLEGPISSRGEKQGSIYSFRADPSVVEGLKFAGFDILSLANNHIFDYGSTALLDTISYLGENNIDSVGAGKYFSEANQPVIKEIKNTKIAFLAYTNLYPRSLAAEEETPGISLFELEGIKKNIHQLKEIKKADIVIISLHWGEEYQNRSNEAQQKIAHGLAEAGADLIIGHHPHVIQEIEFYKGSWIAYSLGNFIFDQSFSPETMEGLALSVDIKNKEISKIQPLRVRINNTFQPEIVKL